MTEVSVKNFGFLIAYIIPGFVVVAGTSTYSETLRSWLGQMRGTGPTIGGFLYATVASVAAGMTVSAIRWFVLDFIHHRTGVRRPSWDLSKLQRGISAFEALVEYHYRYYQFYANTLVALILTIAAPRVRTAVTAGHAELLIAVIGLLVLFFVASRDSLCKYYSRSAGLLGKEGNRD